MLTRSSLLLVAAALLAAACSPAEVATTTPAPTTTSTTVATTTTAATTTTTTTRPVRSVTVDAGGSVPAGIVTAVTALYDRLVDDHNPDPPAVDGALPAELPVIERPETVPVTATVATLPDGAEVAVAHAGGDLILLVDQGDGWQIAGATLAGQAPWLGPEPAMVLVLGSDARPGQDQLHFHADSIHVLTALPSRDTGTILGFPRDSYVPTPFGKMKLTALMVRRGPDVMVDEMRDHFGIPVEGYVVTGFKGFEDLMGELGSVVVDIPINIPTQAHWPGWRKGPQRLSPTRSLDFNRTRKKIPGGDFTRSRHQGLFMLAVLSMLQEGSVDAVPALLATLEQHAWTDLPPARLLQLGVAALELDPAHVDNEVLPGKLGRAPDRASVVFLTPEADAMIADLADDGLLEGG